VVGTAAVYNPKPDPYLQLTQSTRGERERERKREIDSRTHATDLPTRGTPLTILAPVRTLVPSRQLDTVGQPLLITLLLILVFRI
jgi:hypothetical protein